MDVSLGVMVGLGLFLWGEKAVKFLVFRMRVTFGVTMLCADRLIFFYRGDWPSPPVPPLLREYYFRIGGTPCA